jgi:spore maturation protein CgeB
VYLERGDVSPTDRIDWEGFGAVARLHTIDWRLLLLKRALTATCSLVWGQTRGARAARRLVFELSWRLAGSCTYSAAGWPGRLFYEVS